MPYCYVVQGGVGNSNGWICKIGYTIDYHRRIKNLKQTFSGSSKYLIIIKSESAKLIEKRLHEIFSKTKAFGIRQYKTEEFLLNQKDIDFIFNTFSEEIIFLEPMRKLF
jgi:hypothetical protein